MRMPDGLEDPNEVASDHMEAMARQDRFDRAHLRMQQRREQIEQEKQKQHAVTLPAIAKDPFMIRKIPKSKQTEEEILAAVVDDGSGRERPALDDKGVGKRQLNVHFYEAFLKANPWRIDEVPEKKMRAWLVRAAVEHMQGHPETLAKVPTEYKTKPICSLAVELEPAALQFVPDDMKTPKMCESAVARDPACAQWAKQEDEEPPAEPLTGALSDLLQHASKTEENSEEDTNE